MIAVSRETEEKLRLYVALLEKWNPKINLVAPSTLRSAWDRHILDSLQVIEAAPRAKSWVDLGSGGGFPGAVVAIALAVRNPDARVTLIESDQRKSAFLRTVSRETEVPFSVISRRIEEAEPQSAEVVSARALAPLHQLLSYVDRHAAPKATALLLKGRSAPQEIETALEHWRFHCETLPSQTDPEAVILKIGEIERV